MEKFIRKVLHNLGFSGTEIVKVGRSNSPAITSYQLVQAILNTDNTITAAKYLSIGEQTINRILTKVLVPCFGKLNGGNETWKYVLLKNAELKECHICGYIKEYYEFSKDMGRSDGLDTLCKSCKKQKNSNYYVNNKDRYHKVYIQEHRAEYNARNAKRRSIRLQRTPSWANLDKIKDFYLKCPIGYHVDHIVPLQGDTVSGLHVEYNLQYLTASENMSKGNKFSGGLVELVDTSGLSPDASA